MIAAGREALARTGDYLEAGVGFGIETTLASRKTVELINRAKARGYETHLAFIALDSPERNMMRIQNRVALGGHFIPDADVRRRYVRSMANCAAAIRLADIATVYDNTGTRARLVLMARAGVITWRSGQMPQWAERLS